MTRFARNFVLALIVMLVATVAVRDSLAVSSLLPGSGAEQKAAAAPAPEVWPMPIAQFLAGNYLQRADVVLTRRDYDFASYLIRWATDSPFSHAALVFNQPDETSGISSTFVIEAGTGGVDLTNIQDYLSDKSSFVALKRFKQPWFDPIKQARVRGILLEKIKANYNYWAIGRIARNIWFGVQNNLRIGDKKRSSRERVIKQYRENDWKPPTEYICSGLVQVGFVEAALEYIEKGLLPPETLNEVVFQPGAERWLPPRRGWRRLGKYAVQSARLFRSQNAASLEAVTPHDLAVSDKLDWLYFIRDGKVYKVSSLDDVEALLSGGNDKISPAKETRAPVTPESNG